ncbi:MAG TPA: thiamine phosphate synthase [Bacillota bacterium]|nr:thiamine phosphate synthase [Bacillota bacterium]
MQENFIQKIRQWDVYLVIGLYGYNGLTSLEIIQKAIKGGVKVVQIREKMITDEEFILLSHPIRRLCKENQVVFIVNDRVQAAVELDADGVHVGQDDMPGSEVRKWMGSRILGISASSIDEARKAIAEGADYLGVGSIYPTNSKADAGEAVTPLLIKQIREFTDIPIVGIGGINETNAANVILAGAESVAVISAICHANDPYTATNKLVGEIQKLK